MTTPRFDAFIPWIHEWEDVTDRHGNVITEHDPDDPGGATKYGIDKSSHPNVNVEKLTREQADQLYFSYPGQGWQPLGCEDMAPKLGEAYFNAVTNAGKGRADKLLTESGGDPKKFILAQGGFYRRLVINNPRLKKYYGGWINRLNSLWDKLELGKA